MHDTIAGVLDGYDAKTAYELYLSAAESGHLFSQVRMWMYHYLEPVERGKIEEGDLEKAHGWILAAAKNGHPFAMDMVGDMYYYGKGVEKDEAEGELWYKRAAQEGEVSAMKNLLDLGYSPEEVEKIAYMDEWAVVNEEEKEQKNEGSL